ncbi:MAG: DUF4870 domain-containing protein [Austwickia sp.]|jgi:uncharacterized Tic20 family protein|nr:DUF4870 domain-containing protein [Austwickia sp.]MBK8437133.1 DUF4870 domain-containing protein [Austwickia sp.]MBK9102367.1 DUF4870 domain-containing protein [Austwickia sp.]
MSIQDSPYSRGTLAPADERSMAIIAHLSAIIAMVVSAGWLSFAGPLLVWFLYKDKSPYVRQAAAGAFNFNVWAWAMSIVGWILMITVIGIPIAIILWAVAGMMTLWCHIHGAVRAANHQPYRYPVSIRLLS